MAFLQRRTSLSVIVRDTVPITRTGILGLLVLSIVLHGGQWRPRPTSER
jgi:hypothetical protein